MRLPHTAACLLALTFIATLHADVIQMQDGRRFEGTTLVEGDNAITLDAMVTGIRVTLTLPRNEIASHEIKTLPTDFYETRPKPAARISNPREYGPGVTPYLEIPIQGAFAKQVFAEGLHAALAYARRYNIEHVVFIVDSEGGDLDEALAIAKLLRAHDDALTYHSIVRKAVDGGIIFPLFSDTVYAMPGATAGASGKAIAQDDLHEETGIVLRARLADQAVAIAQSRNRPGTLTRRMIDPSESLAVWLDADDHPAHDTTVPEGMDPKRVILSVQAGAPLLLNDKQLVQIGIPLHEGTVAELGTKLNLTGWRSESDYATKAMTTVMERHQRMAAAKASQADTQIRKNVSRREETNAYIESNMRQAAKWDPSKGSYDTYATHYQWGWGWGGWGEHSGNTEENRMTRDSRLEWVRRTDTTVKNLKQAARGVITMKRLDAEAVKLGLEPTFSAEKLAEMEADIQNKYTTLIKNRDKRGE